MQQQEPYIEDTMNKKPKREINAIVPASCNFGDECPWAFTY